MRRARGWILGGVAGLVGLAGCGGRISSLLLERQARGPIAEEASVAKAISWHLVPVMQTELQRDVEVNVNHASREYLANFFSIRNLFGHFAGPNPYYPEHMVFYVKIANQSEGKIHIDPREFTLIDDRGNQYATVGADYVTAFAESRQPVSTTTRGVLEGANPGYFGLSVPVGRFVAGKPQGQFARLQQAALQAGYLYPGVVYDGLIAFWNPSTTATTLRLLVTNIKADFDANDEPKTALEFSFEFTASNEYR